MKLPLFNARSDWKPRDRMGLDSELDPLDRKMLDAVDVAEQKSEYAIWLGSAAINGVILLFIIVALTQGPDVAIAVKDWLLHR